MPGRMERTRSKGKARQLQLAERGQRAPQWASLPEECRREVLELLARLLRNEAIAEEVGDE